MTPAPDLRRVFREHAPRVWRTLRYLGVAPGDLPDQSQEVFIVVFRRLDSFDAERGSLAGWIRGICVRVASTYRRRPHRRHEEVRESLPSREQPPTQLEAVSRGELREMLLEALETLPDEQREVLVLYEIEQLRMREIAELLGIPLQTAYSRRDAGRRRLATMLGRRASSHRSAS